MNFCHFLIFFFLLLAPNQHFQNSVPTGVSCDYAPSYDARKKNENYMSTYKTSEEPERNVDPLTVKVRYEPSDEEKCSAKKKLNIKEDELSRQEMETVKLVAAKRKSEKSKAQEENLYKPPERVLKSGPAADEYCPIAKKQGILCAECEQCELQIKANGEGVLLKCKGCREVSSNDIIFPSGNNRKIITLP